MNHPDELPPGRALELEVKQFLRAGGFRTRANARAARPRQTDLYAQGHDIDLLVEVKDRKRKIDVSDIDTLRARLGRTTPDVVGAIFTTSGVTEKAIKEIEADRTREVLVVVKEEIDLLREGRINAQPLILRKRQELRVNGRAYFGPVATADFLDTPLPRATLDFQCKGRSGSYFVSKTGFAHAAFAMEVPDPGYGKCGGGGVMLPMRLTLSTVDDLRDIVGCLHETFGLSSSGAFRIRQTDRCWHGAGVEEFIVAVRQWRDRYDEAAPNHIHHSEDIMYLDQLRDGWAVLTTRQRVHTGTSHGDRDSYLHDSELAIHLPGVPLDAKPFLDLCRYTGNEWGQFEFIAENYRRTKRLKTRVKLDVVGTVIRTSAEGIDRASMERTVVGVIARNPFYRKRSLPKELHDEVVPLHDILPMELLLCDIKDWHDEGDVVDEYLLDGFETTFAHTEQIIRPFGTWNKILKHARDRQDSATAGDGFVPEMFSVKFARNTAVRAGRRKPR